MDVLNGEVTGALSTVHNVSGDISIGSGTTPLFPGEYTVTPSEETQTLETDGYRMGADVEVLPIPSEYIIPSGTKSIVSNGTVDVAEYAEVDVDVPGETYTDDGNGNITISSAASASGGDIILEVT